MDEFENNINYIGMEHLLKATPYTKETNDNFDNSLDKKIFFKNLYTDRNSYVEYESENNVFDNKINSALRNLNNKYAKVSMIHISGYGGCGKTTYIHHLLWVLKDNVGVYDVIDYEGCNTACEPFINRISRLIYRFYQIDILLEYLDMVTSHSLYNINRFRMQVPILKKFTELVKKEKQQKKLTENDYRVILEKYEVNFVGEKLDNKSRKEKEYLSFLLFLEFLLLLFDRFMKDDENPMILVVDNIDSLSDMSEEMILLPVLKEFENNCNYFFGWNIDSEEVFNKKRVSDILERTKLSMFFTTRVATIKRYEIIEPDWERINGWLSITFPEHYYDHKEIIEKRISYYLNNFTIDDYICDELKNVKKLSEIAYRNSNFMRLFNGSYRVCVERICWIVSNIERSQIEEMFELYAKRTKNKDSIEGTNGYFLYMILAVFKSEKIYQEKLNLSICSKDGKISISRIILTILREKGGDCSFYDLLELLTPLGYDAQEICTQVWNLCEISRSNAWRRLLVFDVIIPANINELRTQAVNYQRGDRNVENYSELVLCTAGKAYMEFVVPHFEFILSRLEPGDFKVRNRKFEPLFSKSSEIKINDKSKKIYGFDIKIGIVLKAVEECCYNSVIFAKKVEELLSINHEQYINTTFYNYHSVGWNNEAGYKQSYESRLIFRHIGYIEKYRCYLLCKDQFENMYEKIEINKRLVCWIIRYIKLYMDPQKCYQTEGQNIVANKLLEFAHIIKKSEYLDFNTRIELND